MKPVSNAKMLMVLSLGLLLTCYTIIKPTQLLSTQSPGALKIAVYEYGHEVETWDDLKEISNVDELILTGFNLVSKDQCNSLGVDKCSNQFDFSNISKATNNGKPAFVKEIFISLSNYYCVEKEGKKVCDFHPETFNDFIRDSLSPQCWVTPLLLNCRIEKNSKGADLFIDKLIEKATELKYDGIDIDIEASSMDWLNRIAEQYYVVFIKEIYERLKKTEQQKGKKIKLSVALNDFHVSNGYYDRIAENVDEFRLMTYDFDLIEDAPPTFKEMLKLAIGCQWDKPASIGSYPCMEGYIDLIGKRVPMEKLWLGIPAYGRKHPEKKDYAVSNISGKTTDTVQTLLDKGSLKINEKEYYCVKVKDEKNQYTCRQWNNTQKSPYIKFTDGSTMWYEDKESFDIRYNYAKEKELAGVFVWRFYTSDKEIWQHGDTNTVNTEKIVFASNRDGHYEVYIMNTDGSSQTRLTTGTASSNGYYPRLSPDGSKIIFISNRDSGGHQIYSMNVDGSSQTRLTTNSADNGIGSFNPDQTKIVGYSNLWGYPWQLITMNSDGTGFTRLTSNSDTDVYPAYSPDGTKIVYADKEPREIAIINSDGTNNVLLTNNSSHDQFASFSPDGTKIVFTSNRDGNYEIYVMNVDGTNQTRLTNNTAVDEGGWFSPDGTKIVFHSNRDGNYNIYVMNSDGTGQTQLTSSASDDLFPSFRQPTTSAYK